MNSARAYSKMNGIARFLIDSPASNSGRRDLVIRHHFQRSQNRGAVPDLAAERGAGVEQLLGRGGAGQREPERPRYDGKATYGVGVMKEPVNTVTIAIDGIGELTNEFRQQLRQRADRSRRTAPDRPRYAFQPFSQSSEVMRARRHCVRE